jgi:hypothetical protein
MPTDDFFDKLARGEIQPDLIITEEQAGGRSGPARRVVNGSLTSFISKYPHFHCPVVPIFDARADAAISKLIHRRGKLVRKALTELPKGVGAYRSYVAAFIVLTSGPIPRPRPNQASKNSTTCSGCPRAKQRQFPSHHVYRGDDGRVVGVESLQPAQLDVLHRPHPVLTLRRRSRFPPTVLEGDGGASWAGITGCETTLTRVNN